MFSFVVPPPSLLLFSVHPCFTVRGGGFCYSVIISSQCYTPSRAACEPEVCVFPLRFVSFLALLLFTFFFLLLFLPFFDFDLDSFCSILSFSFGYYAVSSVSVSAATRLAHDRYLDIDVHTYADLTFLYLRYTICFSYCVYDYLPFFTCFLPEVIFRSGANGACPVTTDCTTVAMT